MTVATEKRFNINWLNAITLTAIHLVALLALFPSFFSWSAVGVALIMHWVTGGLGITLGFHRLVTHRSFQTPKFIEYFLVICGCLACQGGAIDWVGLHRIHHKYSDLEKDPHDSKRGFWWSHLGWMYSKIPANQEIPRYTQDIWEDPFYQFCNNYFALFQIALGLIFYFIGGWSWVIWGIFVRLVVVFHCTWFVNSASHMFGYQTYESKDDSKNCWWVALLTYGEGWHNNHHAFQYSARHGLQWWEVDITWMTIWLLQSLGLATKVKLADK